jgi:hypothetical protein
MSLARLVVTAVVVERRIGRCWYPHPSGRFLVHTIVAAAGRP